MAQNKIITPCLWFDSEAEEAANLYVSIFKNSGIDEIIRYTEAGQEIHGKEAGSVMTVSFHINWQAYVALNGGPIFQFNESVSFQVPCDSQEEIDYYWNKFIEDGGEEGPCGWLKDKFGLSWQITPAILPELLKDPKRASRVMEAYLKMKKFDLETLLNA